MTFRATTLPGQRTHLALHFRNQIVKTRQIDARFFQTTLGATTTVTIQANTGRLFKQFAAIIWAIGKQGINHAAFNDNARICAQPGSANEILNVAQTTERAIEHVLALTRTQQATGYHNFFKRHRQIAVFVVKVQRYFRHVHRATR